MLKKYIKAFKYLKNQRIEVFRWRSCNGPMVVNGPTKFFWIMLVKIYICDADGDFLSLTAWQEGCCDSNLEHNSPKTESQSLRNKGNQHKLWQNHMETPGSDIGKCF